MNYFLKLKEYFSILIAQKSHPVKDGFSIKLMSGSALLSHGETPHYHRRNGVSLLSSAWGQVGPPRYCRQTNPVFNPEQADAPFQGALLSETCAFFSLKTRKTPSVLSG